MAENEKGFLDKLYDKLMAIAAKNPNGANAFIPAGSLKVVELALTSSGIPVKKSDGSYKTPTKKELSTAKKLLGVLGTAAIASPAASYIVNGLKIAGLAMTPSTWIDGVANAFGYTAPKALSTGADLAASAYFANEAGKAIDEEGLNWKTGLNALLSLAPMTKDAEAVSAVSSAVRNPVLAVRSVVDDFKMARKAAQDALSSKAATLGRRLSESVDETKLINIPVEHVTPNGVTKGSALEVGNEGIHLSSAGSPTTFNVVDYFFNTGRFPFVRTGTWTYSNNTAPVEINDVGGFFKGANPRFDNMVSEGVTNFSYANNFEGKGNTSYLTIEPSWGLLLSKNVLPKIQEEKLRIRPKSGITPELNTLDLYLRNFKVYSDNAVNGSIGNNEFTIYKTKGKYIIEGSLSEKDFSSFNDVTRYLENLHEEYVKTLSPLQNTVYLELPSAWNAEIKGSRYLPGNEAAATTLFSRDIKLLMQSDIDNFYMSPEYKERFLSKPGGFIFYPELKLSLQEVKSATEPSSYRDVPESLGYSAESDSKYNSLGINTNILRSTEGLENTITHEFGHSMYRPWLVETNDPLYFIIKVNEGLTNDALFNLNPGVLIDDYTKYISLPNELRQRIIPYVKRSFLEGLTPEETYDIITDEDLKETFKKDYIIKLIGGLLSSIPMIKLNDKTS